MLLAREKLEKELVEGLPVNIPVSFLEKSLNRGGDNVMTQKRYGLLRAHEEYRWSYMTDQQLLKRLDKITQLDKLQVFMGLAIERRKSLLFSAAQDHKVVWAKTTSKQISKNIKQKKVRKEEKVVKEKDNIRYLDF